MSNLHHPCFQAVSALVQPLGVCAEYLNSSVVQVRWDHSTFTQKVTQDIPVVIVIFLSGCSESCLIPSNFFFLG